MSEVTAQNRPRAFVHRVTPDFFSTLRIPLLAGRTFAPNEIVPDTPAVIVTERLVRRFWPGQDPLGKRLKLGDLQSEGPWRQVIGVIPDVKYRGLPENPTADADLFFPMLATVRQVAIVVRTSLPPSSVAGPLRAAVQELNPAIPVYNAAVALMACVIPAAGEPRRPDAGCTRGVSVTMRACRRPVAPTAARSDAPRFAAAIAGVDIVERELHDRRLQRVSDPVGDHDREPHEEDDQRDASEGQREACRA
jgi:hypothetical protein